MIFIGARAARLQLTNDISQPRGLVVTNINYLGKPTQGKGFAVVTLTKRYRDLISRGPIDVYRSAIAPKKPSPSRAQRDARSAYKIDRDAAGGVVDLVRLSGAKEHRFSRSDRPLWLAPPASSARRSAPSTGCGWKHLPPTPSARGRACAAGFSRSAVAPSRFAIRRVVPALDPNHHTHSSGTMASASRQRAAGAASTGCGSYDRTLPPLLVLALCAAGFSQPIVAPSRFATRNHHTPLALD